MTFCERGFQLGNGFGLARTDNERNVAIDETPRDGSADAVREARVDDCGGRRVSLQPGKGVRTGRQRYEAAVATFLQNRLDIERDERLVFKDGIVGILLLLGQRKSIENDRACHFRLKSDGPSGGWPSIKTSWVSTALFSIFLSIRR